MTERFNPLEESANDDASSDDGTEPAGYPLPPLFLDPTRDQHPTTPERLATVDVRQLVPGRSRPTFLGYRLIEHLPDENAILKLYGPGDFELIGRNGNRSRILARVVHSIEAPPAGAAAPPPAPATSSAPERSARGTALGGEQGLLAFVLDQLQEGRREQAESRRAERELLMTMLSRSEKHGVDMVQAVSSLASARISDLKEIAVSKGGGSGASDPAALLKAGMSIYEENISNALDMAQALRDQQGESGGGSEVDLVKSIVEGIKSFKDDPEAERRIAVMLAEEQAKRAPKQ